MEPRELGEGVEPVRSYRPRFRYASRLAQLLRFANTEIADLKVQLLEVRVELSEARQRIYIVAILALTAGIILGRCL